MEFCYELNDPNEMGELSKIMDRGDLSSLVPDSEKGLFDGNEFDGMLGNVDFFDTLLFDDAVLNDCMMSEASQPNPTVKAEHSYSMHRVEEALDMRIKQEKMDDDYSCLSATVDPNHLMRNAEETVKDEPEDEEICVTDTVKEEIEVDDYPASMYTVGPTKNPQTLLRPTIILANQSANKVQSSSVQRYKYAESDKLSLPPTPPSSHTSDSDGCYSPERSSPSTPERSSSLYCSRQRDCSSNSSLFMSPIPTSGVLLLSEEEKRTLIAEGYPVPQKLPLSKQEEKNLKKIRRKIKNKISAQESRRKKKEYVEGLERKVEAYSQENTDLRRRVDHLETNNRSLLSQLQKLQTLVSKFKPSPSVQSTGIMVVMLCFAVFFGAWSPATVWNASYGHKSEVSSAADLCVPPSYKCWNVCCEPHMVDEKLQPPPLEDDDPVISPPMDSVTVPARVLLGISGLDDDYHCHRASRLIPWDSYKSIKQHNKEEITAPADYPVDNVVNVSWTAPVENYEAVIITEIRLAT